MHIWFYRNFPVKLFSREFPGKFSVESKLNLQPAPLSTFWRCLTNTGWRKSSESFGTKKLRGLHKRCFKGKNHELWQKMRKVNIVVKFENKVSFSFIAFLNCPDEISYSFSGWSEYWSISIFLLRHGSLSSMNLSMLIPLLP